MSRTNHVNGAALAEQARYHAHIEDLEHQLRAAAGPDLDQALDCVATLQQQGETRIFALATTIRIYGGQP